MRKQTVCSKYRIPDNWSHNTPTPHRFLNFRLNDLIRHLSASYPQTKANLRTNLCLIETGACLSQDDPRSIESRFGHIPLMTKMAYAFDGRTASQDDPTWRIVG